MNFELFKKELLASAVNRVKTDKKFIIVKLKAQITDYKILKKFIKKCYVELSPLKTLFDQMILGENVLPKNYISIGKRHDVISSNSLISEINWTALSIEYYSELINKFNVLKNEFEICLLKEEYQTARSILDDIDKNICISLWGIENRLVLDEYQYGTEKNWETRNLLVNDENEISVRIISDFLSRKAEIGTNFSQYNYMFEGWDNLQKEIYNNPIFSDSIRFSVNYFSGNQYKHLASIVFQQSRNSIIDRYLNLIRILQHVLLEKLVEKYYLIDLLTEISGSISDISLKQMLLSLGSIELSREEVDHEIIRCIDLYTLGKYQECVSASKHLLENGKCNIIDIYEIYNKSLVIQKMPFEMVNNIDSISNEINSNMYNLISKNDKTDDSIVNLLKIIYTFNNNHLGYKLFSFLRKELNWNQTINYDYIGYLNSQFVNPQLVNNLIDDNILGVNYMNMLSKILPNSPTVKIFNESIELLKGNSEMSEESNHFQEAPSVKKILYKIRIMKHLGKHELVKKLYEKMLSNYDLDPVNKYEAVNGLLLTYLILGDSRSCIKLYVSSYLNNNNIALKLNSEEVVKNIISKKFKNLGELSTLIELPIVFKISLPNETQKIHWAYRAFLSSLEINRPSQINKYASKYDNEKLKYFLNEVCSIEVMQHSIFFKGTEDVSNERIKVCQILVEIDEVNFKSYNDEISRITQKNEINKVIKHMDESKIYVNDEKLKLYFSKQEIKVETSGIANSEKSNFLTKDNFNRYISLRNFLKHNEYKHSGILHLTEKHLFLVDQSFYDFKEMFLELRDYFLFSNEYGLDAYLSTRIRHGTLLNQVRNVFEAQNLVTSQNEGVYTINEHWISKLPDTEHISMKGIQTQLGLFSSSIDELSRSIKDELIQVKTERKNDKKSALFDFEYTDWELSALKNSKFRDVLDYDSFITIAINTLWNHTEYNLKKVRYKIENEIKKSYIDISENLKSNLNSIVNREEILELHNSINLSITNIQAELENISQWFKRSEATLDSSFALKMIIETSISVIKNIYPNYMFNPTLFTYSNFTVNSKTGLNLVDVMKILLENMVRHSLLTGDSVGAEIVIKEKDAVLNLVLKNRLSTQVDLNALNDKLVLVKEKWCDKVSDDTTKEGGTGFSKIKKILSSDLNRKLDDFSYNVDGNLLEITISFETKNLKNENSYN